MAVLISIPTYVPDPTSTAVVTGYQVQSCAPTNGLPLFTGTWSDITGSPFTSPHNIVDSAGTQNTQYRVRPVLQVGSNTLDVPWSKPFLPGQQLFDFVFTRLLLPALRFTYLGDNGVSQVNGTNVNETTGAGIGLWKPDGTSTRFNLQYVSDDDPIRVMDSMYILVRKVHGAGSAVAMVPDQDYSVDLRNAVVTFAVAPNNDDYLRFEFRRCDFVNDDLMLALSGAVNTLSGFGINGYGLVNENNLILMNQAFANNDVMELTANIAGLLMRAGQTELGLRSSYAWRDGSSSADPFPSRGLEFLIQQSDSLEKKIRRLANNYLRGNTRPRVRGDYDIMFDMTNMAPVSLSMFAQFSSQFGFGGINMGGFFYPWWL